MIDQALYGRLIAKIRKEESGCWIWTGTWHSYRKYAANRYGYIAVKNKEGKWRSVCTHRAMYIALHGPLTKEQEVCHKCDVPLCINPDHLFLGTHKENMADSRAKGRHYLSAKTICKRGHSLAPENVYVAPDGCRHCRECTRLRMSRAYHSDRERGRRLAKQYRERKKALRNNSTGSTVLPVA